MKRSRSSPVSKSLPRWLSPAGLDTIVHRDKCTRNAYGVLTPDHIDVKWPLPIMFGEESYAFSLINITDPRYTEVAITMSHKLLHLFYDLQIVEHEWRRAYKSFLEAESRKLKLTPGVLQKSRDKAEEEYNTAKEQLLRLQDQRDLFDDTIEKIFDRCKQIKTSIIKEQDLEKLRESLNSHVRNLFPADHPFWNTPFDVKPSNRGHTVGHRHHHHHNSSHHRTPI